VELPEVVLHKRERDPPHQVELPEALLHRRESDLLLRVLLADVGVQKRGSALPHQGALVEVGLCQKDLDLQHRRRLLPPEHRRLQHQRIQLHRIQHHLRPHLLLPERSTALERPQALQGNPGVRLKAQGRVLHLDLVPLDQQGDKVLENSSTGSGVSFLHK
jgi:hypothetical protein